MIYIFYGEEEYLLENNVNKIKKAFGDKTDGINYIQIDETNIDKFLPELQTPAFGYEKKLIILKKTNLLKKAFKNSELQEKILEYFTNNLNEISSMNDIVFIEDKVDKTKLFKFLEENNAVINEFKKLQMNELIAYLKNICTKYNVQVDNTTLSKLIDTSGTSMQVLINEIRKLIEYTGSNGKITSDMVEKLATKNVDSIIFDLTDCLGAKNIKGAIQVYNELLYQGEPLQRMLVMLYRHYKKLYMTKLAIKYNKDVFTVLQLKPTQTFMANKYKKQAQIFSESELRNKLLDFSILEQKYKTGLIDINIGFEALLCS